MSPSPDKPSPTNTAPGTQMDDNIDEFGRKPDGSKLDQPSVTNDETGQQPASKAVDDENPDYSPMTERGPDGRAHKTTQTEVGVSKPEAQPDTPLTPPIVRSNPD